MLKSRFCIGKETLNDFFKLFNVPYFNQSNYHTVSYYNVYALIYAHPDIFAENLLLLCPLKGLALKWQLLFLFSFFVVIVSVSGCIQTFTFASSCCCFHHRRPLGHSFRLLITRRGLSLVYFCFSHRPLPFRVVYFQLPSSAS